MSDLVIYDSLEQKKRPFLPIRPPFVKMYVCGPTVYGLLHVGNFRGPVIMNFVRNWLEKKGFQVEYHSNFTDVDDKIIERAQRENQSAQEVAEHFVREYVVDHDRLKLRDPDKRPKVTESMEDIIAMVEGLIAKGHAYAVDGDVQFSIRSFADYGKLTHRKPEDMLTAVRIEKDPRKKDPLDFALWKAAKPGEPSWPSPWGNGRPGWHIECSAMIQKHLGETIDIHGGGMDLQFPHHENEIAQSEGFSGHTFVKYWMHWNLINFGGSKMSKSLGNIVPGRDFMDQYTPEVLKFMTLGVHYRSPLDLSEDAIHLAISGLARIYSALALAEEILASSGSASLASSASASLAVSPERLFGSSIAENCNKAWAEASAAIDDDFNTPEAFARLFEIVRQFNGKVKRGAKVPVDAVAIATDFKTYVQQYGRLMSLFQESPAKFLRELDDHLLERLKLSRAVVDAKVTERRSARDAKDFARADALRAELTQMGIAVSDTPTGTFWEVSK